MRDTDESRIAHLGMVQAVIGRMAQNSFLLKGWSVTLVAALLAFAAERSDAALALVALLPALSLWGLDAYYLRQERLFRALYDDVRSSSSAVSQADASFSLSTANYISQVPSWFGTLWSPSIVGLHGVVAFAALLVVLVLSWSE